jgi:hypothetical protein
MISRGYEFKRACKEKSMRYVREGLAFALMQNNHLMRALLCYH